jgi:hypothetical protein
VANSLGMAVALRIAESSAPAGIAVISLRIVRRGSCVPRLKCFFGSTVPPLGDAC